MTQPAAARTEFDWAVYADATFAGLSMLIPIPFVDSVFEWFFSRRMAERIARRRGRRLPLQVAAALNRDDRDWLKSCLLLPLLLGWELVKRLSKKLLYFLTVKEATDRLSYYWHRAFLLDYALQQGHLDTAVGAALAREALEQVLRTAATSPLEQLAQQLSPHTRHILRSLRQARKGQEDEVIAQKKSMMARAWGGFASYLADLAIRYDEAYETLRFAREIAQDTAAARPAADAAETERPAAPGG